MKKDHVTFQRRPFFTPLWLSGIAAIMGFGVMMLAAWEWAKADSTIVIVIRPAEKAADGGADPPLAPAGFDRAARLARMLGDGNLLGHIDAIYTASASRNRMTVAPLAERLGMAPVVVGSDDSDRLAHRILREHRGGRILIVGPGDKVPEIVGALSGGDRIPPIGDDEFGAMYIVSVPRVGHANTLRVHY